MLSKSGSTTEKLCTGLQSTENEIYFHIIAVNPPIFFVIIQKRPSNLQMSSHHHLETLDGFSFFAVYFDLLYQFFIFFLYFFVWLMDSNSFSLLHQFSYPLALTSKLVTWYNLKSLHTGTKQYYSSAAKLIMYAKGKKGKNPLIIIHYYIPLCDNCNLSPNF